MTGTLISLDQDVGTTYVPNGFDDVDLDLTFAQGLQESGACVLLYVATSAALDTASPVGGPSTLFCGWTSLGEPGTFQVDGMAHAPQLGVTTRLNNMGAPIVLSDSSFQTTVEFEVFEGDQVTVVIDDIPGEDDDGDGQIDEPDELDPADGIDPNAVLLCRGQMRLTLVRAVAGPSLADSPRTILRAGFRSSTGEVLPAIVAVDRARRAINSRVGGLFADRDAVLPAVVTTESNLWVFVEDQGCTLELQGNVDEHLMPSAALAVRDTRGSRTFELVQVGESDSSW